MLKKCIALLSASIIFSMPAITVMAEVVNNDDATGYTQEIVSQNIIGTIGSVTMIPDDDPLLDGHFSNGELVNGVICYGKEEAERVLAEDRALQNETVQDINGDAPSPYIYPVPGQS